MFGAINIVEADGDFGALLQLRKFSKWSNKSNPMYAFRSV